MLLLGLFIGSAFGFILMTMLFAFIKMNKDIEKEEIDDVYNSRNS